MSIEEKPVRSASPLKPCGGEHQVTGRRSIERTIQRENRTYDVMVSVCSECGGPLYGVMRTCGASISIYYISREDYEKVEEYVDFLDTTFKMNIELVLTKLRDTIRKYNANGYFSTEDVDVYDVRLLDRARLILSNFSKNGLLSRIFENADSDEDEVAAAFVLGYIANENYWTNMHQDALFNGYAQIEELNDARPLARRARVRQGKRTRRAVTEAASKLYSKNPSLRDKYSKTAALIAEMKLDLLRKRRGDYLGVDAIARHLRAARRAGRLGNS